MTASGCIPKTKDSPMVALQKWRRLPLYAAIPSISGKPSKEMSNLRDNTLTQINSQHSEALKKMKSPPFLQKGNNQIRSRKIIRLLLDIRRRHFQTAMIPMFSRWSKNSPLRTLSAA